LFVFDLKQAYPSIDWETDGHEGSPIFDEDGNVVAVVSAITLTSNDRKILATPIQSPLSPITSLSSRDPSGMPGPSAKCSLADTVRRINEQMSAYASWRVDVERNAEGYPDGQLLLRYESVADAPNIDSIEVEFDFFGKPREGNEARVTSIKYPRTGTQEIT